jgi:hypothetical protein
VKKVNEFIVVTDRKTLTIKADRYTIDEGIVTLLKKEENDHFIQVFSTTTEKLDYIMLVPPETGLQE